MQIAFWGNNVLFGSSITTPLIVYGSLNFSFVEVFTAPQLSDMNGELPDHAPLLASLGLTCCAVQQVVPLLALECSTGSFKTFRCWSVQATCTLALHTAHQLCRCSLSLVVASVHHSHFQRAQIQVCALLSLLLHCHIIPPPVHLCPFAVTSIQYVQQPGAATNVNVGSALTQQPIVRATVNPQVGSANRIPLRSLASSQLKVCSLTTSAVCSCNSPVKPPRTRCMRSLTPPVKPPFKVWPQWRFLCPVCTRFSLFLLIAGISIPGGLTGNYTMEFVMPFAQPQVSR